MNPWGFIIAAIGFVMIYVAVKGNPSGITHLFKAQGIPAPTGTGSNNGSLGPGVNRYMASTGGRTQDNQ